ncbi:MAG: U32 family peptidase [Clostridia bacterium]|nr:U32 family peptidase [Clostridia bacterium]
MEILSPAGSFEALRAAVNHGADAVYVGGARFSARKNAQNFTDEELLEALDFCHVRGVKVYVCCNTLMKESELSDAMAFIRYLYTIGVDALIIQDLGLLTRVRRELPEMPVHASTQMTVANSQGVNLLADLGVKRVVLAREVTGKELSEICKHTKTELEYFVHGALCISYSGQCLMSSILGGRSGNRGGCAQPCRLPYTLLKDGKAITEKQALLCPKDLCLADRVQELKAMGVASLKIEGRMKSPEYVGMVTDVYKRAATVGVTDEEIQDMLKFFSRGGSCYGYFDSCKYGDMMDPVGQNKIAQELPVLEQKKKQVPVYLFLKAFVGEPLELSMTTEDGVSVTVLGEVCEAAHTRATEGKRMREQLAKLGETPFAAKKIEIASSENVAVSVKALNGLRRQAAEELEAFIVKSFRRTEAPVVSGDGQKTEHSHELSLCVEVANEEQLRAAVAMGIRRIYMPEQLRSLVDLVPEPVLQMPPLSKEGRNVSAEGFEQVCVQNLGQFSFAKGKEITAGHRLNITNSMTAEKLAEMGVGRCVVSPELNLKGIVALRWRTEMTLEVIGYGRLPLMLLENCIIKSNGACKGETGCENGVFALQDRKDEIFPLVATKCGNVVYNTKPIYMADRVEELRQAGIDSIRLSFTLEDYETCCNVIREYQAALAGENAIAPDGNFTRGHFYRGMQ